jgi:hypothetical protein
MSCWRKRFTEVGTASRLLGTIPWCVIVACNATWEVVAILVV